MENVASSFFVSFENLLKYHNICFSKSQRIAIYEAYDNCNFDCFSFMDRVGIEYTIDCNISNDCIMELNQEFSHIVKEGHQYYQIIDNKKRVITDENYHNASFIKIVAANSINNSRLFYIITRITQFVNNNMIQFVSVCLVHLIQYIILILMGCLLMLLIDVILPMKYGVLLREIICFLLMLALVFVFLGNIKRRCDSKVLIKRKEFNIENFDMLNIYNLIINLIFILLNTILSVILLFYNAESFQLVLLMTIILFAIFYHVYIALCKVSIREKRKIVCNILYVLPSIAIFILQSTTLFYILMLNVNDTISVGKCILLYLLQLYTIYPLLYIAIYLKDIHNSIKKLQASFLYSENLPANHSNKLTNIHLRFLQSSIFPETVELFAYNSITLLITNSLQRNCIIKALKQYKKIPSDVININKADINDWERNDLKDTIEYLSLDFHQFNITIFDYLSGENKYRKKDIKEVCKKMNLFDTINNLPKKWETIIMDDVLMPEIDFIRLAIAKKLLKDPAVLIIDKLLEILDYDLYEKIIDDINKFAILTLVLSNDDKKPFFENVYDMRGNIL